MDAPLLSLIVFTPLVGAGLILFIPRRAVGFIRWAALCTTFVPLGALIFAYRKFSGGSDFDLVEKIPWVMTFHIEYFLGMDGVSLLLVGLTVFLMPLCVMASWKEIGHRVKEYMFLMLILEVGMIGTFLALDLFLFYIFWELVLIPMYFLIGIWGSGRRVMAAIKFVLYTLVGSVLMLAGILYIYFKAGQSFSLLDWYKVSLSFGEQFWLFLAFGLAFAIKVPMWPFHTWLPDAHTEAPTAGSVILAGVLLKMGTYGFFRFAMPLFPQAVVYFQPWILSLSVVAIIYGALVSMVQPDLKRLVAYSSVSHLGFVMLGLFALNEKAAQGAVLQMINHGLSTGALFLLVGQIYERRHTRLIADYGGIAKTVPLYATFFIFISLSSMGLPGLNNFAGEFFTLLGSFQTQKVYATVATLGVILGAVYLLWAVERIFFGEVTREENRGLQDLSLREVALLIPICLFIVGIGVYPKPWFEVIQAPTGKFIAMVTSGIKGTVPP